MGRRIVEVEGRGERSRRRRRERQAEERRPRDAGNAVRAAGEVLPVLQDQPDDLAEAERDDGEIVAAQPQHRKAEQHAPERRQDAGERQADPERDAEVLRDQRVGIGADRVERDIAEVEQAGEADHDIQAPAEHHVGQDRGCRDRADSGSCRTAPARAARRPSNAEPAKRLAARRQARERAPERRGRTGARRGRTKSCAERAGEHRGDEDREAAETAW